MQISVKCVSFWFTQHTSNYYHVKKAAKFPPKSAILPAVNLWYAIEKAFSASMGRLQSTGNFKVYIKSQSTLIV